MTSLTVEDSRVVVQMVDGREEFFACVGVHPLFADRLAEEKQMDVEQVMAVTSKNVLRAFPAMASAVSP